MIRGTLCILAFMLIFILSAKGDGAYDHIYNVIEEQRLTSEQQKMFNDFYSNVFQYASDRYGIKKAALGTACIVAYVGYSYGDPAYEYKNIKLKPREELIKFLKA